MKTKKKLILLLTSCLIPMLLHSQPAAKNPKLVVVIVIDQMRADYISRFWDFYGDGGFRKLVSQGKVFSNANYNYFPTYTAPGHSCIATGATPAGNGMVGNDWFDRQSQKSVYCTTDTSVRTVGSDSEFGQMSASRLLSTTLGDELRLATNFKSKVIGISIKDRAAILSAGHNASGAYWFDESNGRFITSTYYQKELPAWLNAFNSKKLADAYLSENWTTSLPIDQYAKTCTPDDVPFEGKFIGEEKPVFPHQINTIRKGYNLGLLRSVPNGMRITFDMASAALDGEHLGQNEASDLLAVSISGTDYVGHQFGPRSIEVADMYIKLDQYLAHFMSDLEQKIGKQNFLICLTADHGAADNPGFLQSKQIPAGGLVTGIKDSLNNYLYRALGRSPVIAAQNLQFYFSRQYISDAHLTYAHVIDVAKTYLESLPYVSAVYTKDQIASAASDGSQLGMLKNGYYAQRCGDLTLVLNPGWLESSQPTGTTHGSVFAYDTHVPMLWYGWNLQPQIISKPVHITDIAATLATVLNIQPPSACVGQPLQAITEQASSSGNKKSK